MALAVAFPFLFSYTQPPSTNFWPLMAAGLCGWVVAVVWNARSAGRVNTVRGGWMDRSEMATWLGAGLLLAAVLASAIGLLQYFGAAPGLDPWVHTAKPGQAMGNLRQRNQQATLLSMGLWALLWVVAQTEAHLRASSAGGSSAQAGADLHGGGRPWPLWLVGILTAWALALLAVGSAATASRTGLAQLLVILVLLALWRASVGRVALGLVLAGLAIYAVAAWLLPNLLLQWTGFRAEGLFARFGDAPGCTSRRVLWSNVLHLIAQKPWLGWGWGELDYAHYMTLFPGERFCVLLDNAHNLPLHLAVELGVPVAALLCFAVLAWVWKARPWSETDPARQLAWGILALVGLHSMLEFPLWYGPFQIVTLWALALLWRGRGLDAAVQVVRRVPLGLWAVVAVAGLVLWGGAGVAVPPHQPDLHACGAAHAFHARQPLGAGARQLGVQRCHCLCRADHHAGQPRHCRKGACAGPAHAAVFTRAPRDRAPDRKRHPAGPGRRSRVPFAALPGGVPQRPCALAEEERGVGRAAYAWSGAGCGCGPVVIGTSSYRASSGT